VIDLGIVYSLVLDAVDPRLTAEQRVTAAHSAMDMDEEQSAAMWAGLLYSMLESIGERRGREALDLVMFQLAALAMQAADSPEMNG